MSFLRILTLLFLCIASALVCASEQTPTPIFGLVNSSQDRSQNRTLEFWDCHEYDGSQNYTDTLKLRYYNPLNIGDWHSTLRLDTAYTSAYGPMLPNQSGGTYTADNVMLTIWGSKADWLGNIGARVLAPLANVGQWLAGPQVSTSFTPAGSSKSLLADISPLRAI